VEGAFLGFVGWCAHQDVVESALANGLKLPEIASERDLFEFSRVLNRNGMFGLYSLRSVERYGRFSAAGMA
jgi:hypothetical protein